MLKSNRPFKITLPAMLLCSLYACNTGTNADPASMSQGSNNTLYTGTYTLWGTPPGQGIYSLNINQNGEAANTELAAASTNPSYLIVKNNHVYAVNETEPGTVSVFNIDPLNPLKLTAPNQDQTTASGGNNPVSLAADNLNHLFIANYGTSAGASSGVAALNLTSAGGVTSPYQVITYTGHGLDPDRQSGSHTHSVNVVTLQGQELMISVDLGTDKIHVYSVEQNGGLTEKAVSDAPPGSGPRHLTFKELNGLGYLYVANELNSTIDVYQLDIGNYSLTRIQNIQSYKPPLTAERNYPAEIMLAPNTNTLYVSNRGMDNIAQFLVQDDGKLNYIDQYPTHGTFPRDFDINPNGTLLVAANQTSGNLSIFLINQQTGMLKFTQSVDIPSAVTVKFLR